jgi:hypothetical protein
MSGKYSPIFTCCVCGARLPALTREQLRERGCSSRMADNSEVHHCPNHTRDEILQMARSTPLFTTGNNYRKGILP